jgi:hypothetical protein
MYDMKDRAALARKFADSDMDQLAGTANRLASAMHIFGSMDRAVIALTLAKHGSLCVGRLAEELGRTHAATSHHMRFMRVSDKFKTEKIGTEVYYSLSDEGATSLLYMLRSEGL